MKTKLLFTSLFCLLISTVFAQPAFEWANSIGGTDEDYANSITTDLFGNSISTGYFRLTVDLDPGPGVLNATAPSLYSTYIQKLDANGNLVWAHYFNTSIGRSVVTDVAGNVFVAGNFYNIVDFDPGLGIFNLDATNGNCYVIKLDSSGNLIWAKNFHGTPNEIILDASKIAVTGYFTGTGDFDPSVGITNLTSNGSADAFVVTLDLSGGFLWAKSIGGTGSDYGEGVGIDSNGDVYCGGRYQNTVDFDPGIGIVNGTSAGSWDSFVLKLDSNGDYVWVNLLGSANSDLVGNVVVSESGFIYITGTYSLTCDFDPGVGVLNQTSAGGQDGYIQKIDLNGDLVWAKTFGGSGSDQMRSITLDMVQENVYVTGNFSNTVDFDPGAGIFNLTAFGSSDVCISKLDVNGNFVWAGAFGENWDDYGESISVSLDGDIYVTGPFNYTVDFDPGIGVFNMSSVASSWDAFKVKLNQCEFELNEDLASLPDLIDECSVTTPIAPTASNCTGTYSGTPDVSFPINTQGTTVVTWTYTNSLGITGTQTQNVVITDVTAPVEDAGSLSDITTTCGQSVTSLTAPTATDNCVGLVTGTHNATLPITSPGTTVVTWTYDDGNGNTSTQTQNVIINLDITPPLADSGSLSDITTTCGQSVTSLTAPTATDNCIGAVTGTHNATLPITASGTTVVTWTYDDGNGNTSTQTQNVIINADVAAPLADAGSLSDINAVCSVTSLTPPTATDVCSGSITGTTSTSLPITAQGTTVVTWTYDDGNGNTSTQTQNIIITDAIAPVADLGSLAPVTAECQIASITAPTATDNCAGTVTGTPNVTFPIAAQGSLTITWTYDDGNGNTSTQTQSVTVNDVTAPVVDNALLNDVTAECEVTSLTAPTATDICAGSITGTHNASLPITAQGTVTVTWTYDDGNGNTTTQTQDVVITDATNPVADLANLSDINDECEVTPAAPTATDNCSGAITATPDVSFPITASGTTTVTWTYDDGNGNTSTQTQDVIITPIDNGITQVDAITLSADATGYNYQWVDCDNGNAAISGATSQSFTPTIAGSYACEIDNGTCTVTTACLTSSVGIVENSFGSSLVVYPNPTFGNLKVDLGTVYNGITVKVFNAFGQVVINESFGSTNEINLNIGGTPGMYILEINTEEGKTARVNVIKE